MSKRLIHSLILVVQFYTSALWTKLVAKYLAKVFDFCHHLATPVTIFRQVEVFPTSNPRTQRGRSRHNSGLQTCDPADIWEGVTYVMERDIYGVGYQNTGNAYRRQQYPNCRSRRSSVSSTYSLWDVE